MRIDVFSGPLSKLQTNLLIVTCFKDVRPLKGLAAQIDWYYGGLLSRILMEDRFSGEAGERLLLSSGGKLLIPKVILMGLGLSTAYDYPQLKSISSMLHPLLKDLHTRECSLEVAPPMTRSLDVIHLVEAFLSGEPSGDLSEPLEVTFIVNPSEEAKVAQHFLHNKAFS